MKRNLLLLVLVASVISVFAQSNRTISTDRTLMKNTIATERLAFAPNTASHYLVGRLSDDNYELKSFFYDSEGRIICVVDSVGSEKVRDSIFYDNSGNVVGIRGYQWLNNTWKAVYRLEYEYDQDNNMIHRKNYNSMGTDNFVQGGVYDYIYQDGHIVSHILYLGDYSTLFEECTYIYDSQNRLSLETYMQSSFTSMDSSYKYTYEYNGSGKLAYKTYYVYDEPLWSLYEREEFIYDAAGNCIDHSVRNSGNDYIDRRLYTYDQSVSSSEVSMPYYIPELGYPETFEDPNMRTIERWYSLDDNQVLQFICDYYYIYTVWNGIEEVEVEATSVYPNPVENVLNIQVDEKAISAVLYDMQGRMLQSSACNAGVNYLDMSYLPAGVYFVKLNFTDGKSSVQKVVKK